MQKADIYAKLTSVFRDVFDDDMVLTPELTANDIDGWDSLNHVRLVLAASKAFAIKISASTVSELQNVGDLVALIERKLAAQAP